MLSAWNFSTAIEGCYQEAVSVGIHNGLTPDDYVITSYRCHPFAVLRGGSIKGVIGELLGRKVGMSHGKGGSMHIFTPTFFGGNGIVGAQVPLGAGLAFAQKYSEHPRCTFALYGDGAANQGQVFEAFNMVSLVRVVVSTLKYAFRPNYGIFLASLFAKTTSTGWEHPQSAAQPTPNTLSGGITFPVSR